MRGSQRGLSRAWRLVAGLALTTACSESHALKTLVCPSGQHDGGKGKCVLQGTCADGYYDDGNGNCHLPDTSSGWTDVFLGAVPNRTLDMVFDIDNRLCSKLTMMNAQFPKMIAALVDPVDGTLPDLRIAIIDSDLGTGGAYSSGSCGPKTLPDGTQSQFGDLGRFQMLNSPTACSFYAGATFLEYKNGQPLNYTGDISTVFACLTSNLGNLGCFGCSYQHQLQAFEFALVARGVGNDWQQADFLRPDAFLALIFITDTDDCSAVPNDGIFYANQDLGGETLGLRCATRGHACGGRNLTDAPPGYPTVASFSHAFSDCRARTDTCPNTTDGWDHNTDTSVPTDCSPLKNIKHLADEIKALKADPDHQILAAGIFGWPLNDADMATAEYKIAPVPWLNNTQRFEYWPVCYNPDHRPSASSTDPATGADLNAWGMAAQGGLREAAFLDEFGNHGLKFSICQRDFADTMTTIGNRLAGMFLNLCLDFKLADTDPGTDGVQPECSVFWRIPQPDATDPSKTSYQESATSLPQCPAGATNGTVAEDCWRILSNPGRCPASGQVLDILRTSTEIASQPRMPPGTQLHVRCRTCPDSVAEGCQY